MLVMAKKKPETSNHEKYRKPNKSVRIRKEFIEPVEEARKRLAQDRSEFTNEAVREKLERMGLWPWPPKKE